METTETFQSFIRHQTTPCLCKTETIFPSTKLSTFDARNIAKILDGKVLRLRVGRRNSSEMKWENQCNIQQSCIEDILTWNGIVDCSNTSEEQKRIQRNLGACCNQHYWCYADYMYMKDLFCENQEILQLLDWDSLGFHGKDGGDSTMWLGTGGAHTLCHYDTYGFNIVVQVSGSKKWILFPPSDSEYMYPTRIPYEESSVFSEVNVACPDLQKHPKFDSAQACVITLQPGDILYVPHHWWHYVENLELSVSINLWYEMKNDAKSRLHESVTRLVVGSCAHVSTTSNFPWINPTENFDAVKSVNDNLRYLKQSIKEVSENTNLVENNFSQAVFLETERTVKFPNRSNFIMISPLFTSNYMEVLTKRNETKSYNRRKSIPVKRIKPLSFQNKDLAKSQLHEDMTFTDFVQCLTHKDVIDAVSKVIMKRFDNNYENDIDSSFDEMCSQTTVIKNGLNGQENMDGDSKRRRISSEVPTMCEPSQTLPFLTSGTSNSFLKSSTSQIESYNDHCFSIDSVDIKQEDSDYMQGKPIYKIVIGGSKRGGDKLFDIYGYSYTLKRRSAEGKTWICTARSPGRPACPAAVYQTAPNEFRPNNKSHIHKGNPTGEISSRIMSDIERTIEENPAMSSRAIATLKLDEAKAKWPHVQLPKMESLITQIGRYRRKYFEIPKKPRPVPKHELKAYYGVTERERSILALNQPDSGDNMLTDSFAIQEIDSPLPAYSDDSSGPSSSNGQSNRCLSPVPITPDNSKHVSSNLNLFRHLVGNSALFEQSQNDHSIEVDQTENSSDHGKLNKRTHLGSTPANLEFDDALSRLKSSCNMMKRKSDRNNLDDV